MRPSFTQPVLFFDIAPTRGMVALREWCTCVAPAHCVVLKPTSSPAILPAACGPPGPPSVKPPPPSNAVANQAESKPYENEQARNFDSAGWQPNSWERPSTCVPVHTVLARRQTSASTLCSASFNNNAVICRQVVSMFLQTLFCAKAALGNCNVHCCRKKRPLKKQQRRTPPARKLQ